MSSRIAPLAGPISQDWTVRHLLEVLADDIDAISLDDLLAVEAGLLERSASGQAAWAARPHPVAVIRSIATLTRLDRFTALLTIGELRPGTMAPNDETSTTSATTRERQLATAS